VNSKLAFILIIAALLCGCERIGNSPEIPHVIEISEFSLSTSLDQGTSSHDIDEVWVHTTTDVLGAFPLPAKIPYIDEDGDGLVDLEISAGIRANGISATREPYSFYESMEILVDFVPGDTSTFDYHTEYIEAANIILCEDFESANRFQANSTSTAEVVRTTDPDLVFEGEASGFIQLGDSATHLTSTTQEQLYFLPKSGPIWMEFNYRCDNSFAVGLEVIGGSTPERVPIIVLHPTPEEWKKMYLDLGPLVWSHPSAYGFEITLDAILDPGLDSSFVLVDNFKIVHY
tara:strand:+ start:43 stop:906 length:864 start_codon:yes stop_codon:yes gene_type:complete